MHLYFKYGLAHTHYTQDDDEFWNFSFEEMATYDLPAVIKFIQDETQQGINYVGHSQGGMIALLALNEKPYLQLGCA